MVLRGTFVRIDVEGFELICFRGNGKRLVQGGPPMASLARRPDKQACLPGRQAWGGNFLRLLRDNILEDDLFDFCG